MSAKIKVRAKIPDFSGRDDLTRMFNQMVGVEEPDKNVVLPKFSQYRSNLNKIAKTLKLFSSETFRKRFVEYDSHFEHIAIYVKQCEELIALIDSLSDDEKISRYVEIKSNNAIKNTILNCNLLKNHGANIEKIGEYREQFAKLETTDAEFPRLVSLAGVFIEQYPSSELHLLYVSKINFKTLWFDPRCSFDLKKFIVEMLHVVHKFSRAIFDLYSSPDIDVESFSRILVANLANLRSRIPRCEDAFNRIESSIGMLQNNFGRYYNTFIDTKNTGVFFEDFVMDIATDGTKKQQPELIRQFRQIIKFIHTQYAQQHAMRMDGGINTTVMNNMMNLMSTSIDKVEGDKPTDKTTEKIDDDFKTACDELSGKNTTKTEDKTVEKTAKSEEKTVEKTAKSEEKTVENITKLDENIIKTDENITKTDENITKSEEKTEENEWIDIPPKKKHTKKHR